MGQILFCDLCGRAVPIEKQFQDVAISGTVEARACLNCASQLRGSMQMQKHKVLELQKKKSEEQKVKVEVEGEGAGTPAEPPEDVEQENAE